MNRRRLLSTAVVILLAIFLSHPSWAGQAVKKEDNAWAKKMIQEEKTLESVEARNTLAVLYFKNQTQQKELDPLQKGIALMLITDLSKIKNLQVVERVQLQALAEELGLGTSGLVEASTAPRVGKLLRARWLLGGDIFRGNLENVRVNGNLAEVKTQQVLGQLSSEGQEFFRWRRIVLWEL